VGNCHFDGELWTLDSLLVQKVGNRGEVACLVRVGRISTLMRILGFLLSTVELTWI
jgi:hypothetical protein